MPTEEKAAAEDAAKEHPLPTMDEIDAGREVAIRKASEQGILAPARYGFDHAQVEAIRKTVAADCTDAELVMFLEVCARYQLDPFAKQVFAAKIKNRMQIIVSRDGLLAHAHKQHDFRGLTGDVIHAEDQFKVTYTAEGRTVEHAYGIKDRGEIVGAWAEVKRSMPGQEKPETTFFYAPLDEYKRGGDTPWAKQTSAMILKVAGDLRAAQGVQRQRRGRRRGDRARARQRHRAARGAGVG